jgi:tripartite-type tricarboxylate transporter receptor subunit TctC
MSCIVENRTGAAGRPGVAAVKNAAPDGNTLLITPIAPMAVYQHVYRNLEFDPIKDFAPVSQIATFDFAVAVGPKVPATSLKELVAWVMADPSRAAFARAGRCDFFGLSGRAAWPSCATFPQGSAMRCPTSLPVTCRW